MGWFGVGFGCSVVGWLLRLGFVAFLAFADDSGVGVWCIYYGWFVVICGLGLRDRYRLFWLL